MTKTTTSPATSPARALKPDDVITHNGRTWQVERAEAHRRDPNLMQVRLVGRASPLTLGRNQRVPTQRGLVHPSGQINPRLARQLRQLAARLEALAAA